VRRDDSGQITVFVTVMASALVGVCGLVYDGGGVLAAHQEAINESFEAARSAAQALDVGALRSSGTVSVDPSAAAQAAQEYLASLGHTGTVAVNGDQVTVTVSFVHRLGILDAFGLGPVRVSGTSTVTATQGPGAGP